MKKTISLIILPLLFSFYCCGNTGDPKPNPEEVNINITPENLIFESVGGTMELNVGANAEWGVTSSQSWCKCSPSGGISGNSTIKINVDANDAEQSRTAILTFKSGSYSKQYNIVQKPVVKIVIITDAAFKAYCVANFDLDKDGEISEQEARQVTSIDVSSKGISSLQGLSAFIGLTSLNCNNNKLQTLDVSTLTELKNLYCQGNNLTELNIRSNINLLSLDCTGNPGLTAILVWTGFKATSSFLKPDNALFSEPEIPTPVGYKLVWNDEFNDPRQSSGKTPLPSLTRWWYETGASGWGNNEIQNYIAGARGADTCAVIADGVLKIIAKKVGTEVLSVRMNSTDSWTYGYFEARLKMPTGKGTWPAFWMMPKNFTNWPLDGEIDIMEYVGYEPNVVHASVHTMAYYHTIGTQKTATKTILNAETDFHIYAMEWTADKIDGYVDGVKYFTFNNDKTNNKNTWPFNAPFYLKLNLAWGGNWGGAQGIDATKLPAVYEIDYARVYQK